MDGVYRIGQANLQSFFAIYGDVTRPVADSTASARAQLVERFSRHPIVDEQMARGLSASSASFPARILSAVQSDISRQPERALNSQSNFNMQNVVSLMSVL